jgi:Family of unknown function (DUF6263)
VISGLRLTIELSRVRRGERLKRFRVASIAVLVAVLVDSSSSYGQEATLRYRWVKGEEVRYRVSQQGTTTMSGLPGAGEMTVTQNSVQILRVSVDEAGPESATLRMTFEAVRMEMTTPMTKVVFDSAADKPSDPLGMAMAAMIGESITLVAAPTGHVTRVEGMSRILEKMTKTLPQSPGNAQVFGLLKTSMSDDMMSNMFSQGFAQFPDRAVKAGDSWSHEFNVSVPMVGTLSTTNTSTLKAIELSAGTSLARIATLVVMKQDANAAAAGFPGMTARLANGTAEGEVLFDITKGRVQRTSNNTDLPMSMSMTGPDGTQINAKSVTRTTMTMEIVEK